MQNSVYKIGVDFDNTIICYDGIFNQIGIEKKLIPNNLPHGKKHVRNYLRNIGQEEKWIMLQGYVYGTRLIDAPPFEGVKQFFSYCQKHSIYCCIISHKTLHPYRGYPYNLRKAAYKWLYQNNFQCEIFFESTKADKIKRIYQQECSHFIDDLPEFLTLPEFPETTSKLLFDPSKNYKRSNNSYHNTKPMIKIVKSWKELLIMLQKNIL